MGHPEPSRHIRGEPHRLGPDQSIEYGGQGPQLVAPGTYKVTLTYGEAKTERIETR